MSRELLKQALEALKKYRQNHDDHQPCDAEKAIETYLAQPEPEPEPWLVAWRALNFAEHGGVYAYRDHDEPFVGVSGSNVGEPLYTTPPDQSARIAELEKDNNITHENLAWYMAKYYEHLTIIAEAAHGLGINHE